MQKNSNFESALYSTSGSMPLGYIEICLGFIIQKNGVRVAVCPAMHFVML